jgi:hypothetical protein
MSELFNGSLLKKISALQLPDPEGVVLNSSGALAEWGIIPMESVGDIDATISNENIEALRERVGWILGRKIVGESRHTGLPIEIDVVFNQDHEFDFHRYNFSFFDYYRIGKGRHTLQMQIEHSIQDPRTGIFVTTPEYVVRTKLETGRDKDQKRIEMVRDWYKAQNS